MLRLTNKGREGITNDAVGIIWRTKLTKETRALWNDVYKKESSAREKRQNSVLDELALVRQQYEGQYNNMNLSVRHPDLSVTLSGIHDTQFDRLERKGFVL